METDQSPLDFFKKQLASQTELHSILEKRYKQLSLLRVVLFIASIATIVYLANEREMYYLGISLLLFIALFGILVRNHNKVSFKRDLTSHLIQLNNEEVQRLEGSFQGIADGYEFSDRDHSYAIDLDAFGSNSVFQLLNRSRLRGSRALMASWILNPADSPQIIKRQAAISELSKNITWRQKISALGMMAHGDFDQNKNLLDWLSENGVSNRSFYSVMSYLLPILGITAITMVVLGGYTYKLIFIPVLINMGFVGSIFQRLMDVTKGFENASKSLKSYGLLFECVENESFEAEHLQMLKGSIYSQDKASAAIKSLSNILHQLQNRANILYQAFNLLFALDVFWLLQAENWKKRFGNRVAPWFNAIHEVDVLNDIASFYYANPQYTIPEISETPYTLDSIKLGHPLISVNERVNNDFELNEKGKIGLVTGSNMSGKSTFLRTVGVNLVLAHMGAPVCAEAMTFSITRVFTSMRTQDNLEEHISSFYAELKRIKQLLDNIDEERPIFFLLDEILKGTNSEDRHNGSIALVNQLNYKYASGLISTHDLSLSKLASNNKKVVNYSFNSTIEGNEIIFDYNLSPGPCKSFNASKLMENMGIIIKN